MCDLEPAEVWSSRTVVCRRPHDCAECGTTIMPGQQALRWSCLYDGHWDNGYHCMVCQAMIRAEDAPKPWGAFHACQTGGNESMSYAPSLARDNPWWQEVASALEQVREPDQRNVQICTLCEEWCHLPVLSTSFHWPRGKAATPPWRPEGEDPDRRDIIRLADAVRLCARCTVRGYAE